MTRRATTLVDGAALTCQLDEVMGVVSRVQEGLQRKGGGLKAVASALALAWSQLEFVQIGLRLGEMLAESQYNRARLAEQKLAELERENAELKARAARSNQHANGHARPRLASVAAPHPEPVQIEAAGDRSIPTVKRQHPPPRLIDLTGFPLARVYGWLPTEPQGRIRLKRT